LSISLVSLNSSIGIAPLDFNPKSIKIYFLPISSTVPVVISPSLNFLLPSLEKEVFQIPYVICFYFVL